MHGMRYAASFILSVVFSVTSVVGCFADEPSAAETDTAHRELSELVDETGSGEKSDPDEELTSAETDVAEDTNETETDEDGAGQAGNADADRIQTEAPSAEDEDAAGPPVSDAPAEERPSGSAEPSVSEEPEAAPEQTEAVPEPTETADVTGEMPTQAPAGDGEWWELMEDGSSYDIGVRMYRWPYSDPPSFSMGNGALTGSAVLSKEDGELYAEISFREIDMGSVKGRLIKFWQIPDQTLAESPEALAESMEAAGIIDGSIGAFLDTYAEECEYSYAGDDIESVRLPIEGGTERIICGIESDFAAMGSQLCVISLDCSNAIEAVTGTAPDTEKRVGTPVISTILSADGESFEIAIRIPNSEEASDADIYYMVSGSDDAELGGIVSEENSYAGTFEVSRTDAEVINGSFNVYAVGVKDGYEDSFINVKKITFYGEGGASPSPDPTVSDAPTHSPSPSQGSSSSGEGGGESGGSDEGYGEEITDGKYRVEIALYHASAEQLSMGNAAFQNNSEAIVNVRGGTAVLTCASNPVSIPPYYSALTEMLFENGDGDWQRVNTKKTETITANDGKNTHSLSYMAVFSFALPELGADYVPVKISVPYTPMDDIAEGGYIEARLRIFWDTLTETDPDDELEADTSAASGSAGGSDEENQEASDDPSDAVDVTDAITGIRYTAAGNTFRKNTKLYFNLSPQKKTYEMADSLLEGAADSYKLYVITAKRGKVPVEPAGYVTFYVPVGDTDVNRAVIYRLTPAGDGVAAGRTMIDFEVTEDMKYFVFALNTLGTIAICETDDPPPLKIREPEAEPTETPPMFEDIASSGIRPLIEEAVTNGWFTGMDQTRFGMTEPMTRAMFVTVLGRFDGGEASIDAENPFSDVKDTDYCFPYVLWAYENGIVNGTSGGRFEPDERLTREQLAVILFNYLSLYGLAPENETCSGLLDEERISPWAREAVYSVLSAGLMDAEDHSFGSVGSISRVEAVVMIFRLDELLGGGSEEDDGTSADGSGNEFDTEGEHE